jgi:hypothetical protein
MQYNVEYDTIKPIVEEEISRVATRSYVEGSSLYDAIRVTSRDESTLERLFSDALTTIQTRFVEFVHCIVENELDFNLPDLPCVYEDGAKRELNRFIEYSMVAQWLEEKGNQESTLYTDRAAAALNKAERMLLSRGNLERL